MHVVAEGVVLLVSISHVIRRCNSARTKDSWRILESNWIRPSQSDDETRRA